MSYHYRVIVIGSGSGEKDAALLAARAGKRTLLIESDRIGGTGVHRGCHAVRALRALVPLITIELSRAIA